MPWNPGAMQGLLSSQQALFRNQVTGSLIFLQRVRRTLTCTAVVTRALDDGCDAISGSDGVVRMTGSYTALDRTVSIVPLAVCCHLQHNLRWSCKQWP